jgi:cell fate regulator YaaT (PSP1 superfamily)
MSGIVDKDTKIGQEGTDSQVTVVDVRFRTSRKVYTFEVDDLDIKPGTSVVAETEMGPCIGYVIGQKYTIDRPENPLRKVLRISTEEDIKTDAENKSFEEEARTFCIERAKARSLPMKIVATESTLDRKRLIFYFTADGRIDFRELVRDLAARFKTRIEMRQIGVRDEVKIIGGIGVCGRVTCCSSFLTTFEPISIRMAKQQELALSQSKLSGICGRLMCCIAYEYEDSENQLQRPCKARALNHDETVQQERMSVPLAEKTPEPVENISTEETVLQQTVSRPEVHPLPQDKGSAIKKSSSEERAKEGGGGKNVSSRKRHTQQKTQKKEKKGKPFSKRKKFWKKRH